MEWLGQPVDVVLDATGVNGRVVRAAAGDAREDTIFAEQRILGNVALKSHSKRPSPATIQIDHG